jgi:hypothetical protein
MRGCARFISGFAGGFVVAAGLFTLAARPCFAADRRVHLDVARSADAADCPDAATLAAAVEHAGGRSGLDVRPDSDAPLRLSVYLERNHGGYDAAVAASGMRSGLRTLTHAGATCDPLAKALVVSLMVLLDEVDQAGDEPPAPATTPASTSQAPLAIDSSPAAVPPGTYKRAPSATPLSDYETYEPGPNHRTADNSFFVEVGGNGLVYTINFEHIFGDTNLSLRAGFGYVHLKGTFFGQMYDEEDLLVPLVASYYLGGKNHKLQIGAGALFVHQDGQLTTQQEGYGTFVLGYRYIPSDGGIDFGISFTPLVGNGVGFVPWAGANVGVGF